MGAGKHFFHGFFKHFTKQIFFLVLQFLFPQDAVLLDPVKLFLFPSLQQNLKKLPHKYQMYKFRCESVYY